MMVIKVGHGGRQVLDGWSKHGPWLCGSRLENMEKSELYLQGYTWFGYFGEGIWTHAFDVHKS